MNRPSIELLSIENSLLERILLNAGVGEVCQSKSE